MKVVLILGLLLACVNSQAQMSGGDGKGEMKQSTGTSFKEKSTKTDSKDKGSKDEKVDEKKKMKIGGMYTTDKVANVKSNKGTRPVSTPPFSP